MMKIRFIISLLFILLINVNLCFSHQEGDGYIFTEIKRLPVTSVKDQYRSNTCWSFSALSLLESEILRNGNEEVNLSEMFIVRHAYAEKAKLYIRMHGKMNFSGGGALNDPIDLIKKYGIVPEEFYDGLKQGEDRPVHYEMDDILKGYVDKIAKGSKKLSPVWYSGFLSLLDTYLGEIPETFIYKGKEYTPVSFIHSMGLNLDDYVLLTSFNHHDFYNKFILEVPDNWAWGEAYNLPLGEFKETIYYALEKDYTMAWASDISEKGFQFKKGFAIVPDQDWKSMSSDEVDIALQSPVPQMVITQEMRQLGFDNYSTEDDHGMQIIGTAKDQIDNDYFIVKNSWGTENSKYNGFFYASESFVLLKTLSILVNKNGIPAPIRKKLGL